MRRLYLVLGALFSGCAYFPALQQHPPADILSWSTAYALNTEDPKDGVDAQLQKQLDDMANDDGLTVTPKLQYLGYGPGHGYDEVIFTETDHQNCILLVSALLRSAHSRDYSYQVNKTRYVSEDATPVGALCPLDENTVSVIMSIDQLGAPQD
jgi:hypothetical protein